MIFLYQRNDDEVLSSENQMPPHKPGSYIHRSIGLQDYQNPTNEQITSGSEEVTMSKVKTESSGTLGHSETNENSNELTNNGKNTAKETAGRDNKHDTETLGGDTEVFSLSLTNSLGVDNKGFDCNDKESTFCSPDQVTVAKVDEVNMNDVLSKSSEQNHDVAVSETVINKKSCDLESAFPTTAGPKTVRAWLKDPHLYKVIPLFHSQLHVY